MKNKSFKVALTLSIIFGIAETIYMTVNEMVPGDNFVPAWIASFIGNAVIAFFGKLALFLFIYFPDSLLKIENEKRKLNKSETIYHIISMICGTLSAVVLAIYLHSLNLYFGLLNGAPWIFALPIYCLLFNALTTITKKIPKK